MEKDRRNIRENERPQHSILGDRVSGIRLCQKLGLSYDSFRERSSHIAYLLNARSLMEERDILLLDQWLEE